MLTRDQKAEIGRLHYAGRTYSEIAREVKATRNQVSGFLYRAAHPAVPKPKVKQARPDVGLRLCPEHLKALADAWRAKHGDALVVGACRAVAGGEGGCR